MATEIAIRGEAATREELLERVAREDVRLVDLQFSDIAGGARVMTIPGHLLPSVLQHGYRFDGSAVTGGQREVEMDLFLVPDPGARSGDPGDVCRTNRHRMPGQILVLGA
jgi:glutamine synthetase